MIKPLRALLGLSFSCDDDLAHLVGVWDVGNPLSDGRIISSAAEGQRKLLLQEVMTGVETANAVVFGLLDNLHVVLMLASLYEVEVHVEVDDCFVAMLVFKIGATLSAVNQHVFSISHATDKC